MILLLALVLVVLVAGLGFTLHVLWLLAGVLLVLWLVGYVVGRGESAGRHRFYKW
jgi:Na+-transporting methylmalonyl-CoA/oxaloacetate decarboxylase gamma subunit